ncbi:hypothetical protein FEM33_01280 [Dyadobacter flavalbus]|uniref:Collagen-like protein n=1 Tax=Dyadobacter flavalbus TaxID=2579942 RepID=A0A5M8R294_9BACT|nr:hypothetical protein [Dyadobacter flavalbus]KAA6441648.1 hypothetical protein FEM33_01280 [Dyadobacter flavalbus]
MFKRLLLIAWVGLMVFMVSCKGPQGEVGPQGEKGDTGAAGPAGPAGEDGTSGGGALIISSGADATDSTGSYITGISELTAADDSLLQSSAVLVYIKAQGVYWPLPGIVSFGNNTLSNFTFIHGIEESTFFVQLIQTDWSEQNLESAPERNFEDVRVVIIPGTILGRMNGQINLKSYEETIAALGLTDKDTKFGKKIKLVKK